MFRTAAERSELETRRFHRKQIPVIAQQIVSLPISLFFFARDVVRVVRAASMRARAHGAEGNITRRDRQDIGSIGDRQTGRRGGGGRRRARRRRARRRRRRRRSRRRMNQAGLRVNQRPSDSIDLSFGSRLSFFVHGRKEGRKEGREGGRLCLCSFSLPLGCFFVHLLLSS